MQHRNHALEVWASLLDVARAWWGSDRVRIEPAAGRMLTLRTGAQIMLFDQIWMVTARDVQTRDSHAVVRYALASHEGSAELLTDCSSETHRRGTQGILRAFGRTIPVWDDDVIVLEG